MVIGFESVIIVYASCSIGAVFWFQSKVACITKKFGVIQMTDSALSGQTLKEERPNTFASFQLVKTTKLQRKQVMFVPLPVPTRTQKHISFCIGSQDWSVPLWFQRLILSQTLQIQTKFLQRTAHSSRQFVQATTFTIRKRRARIASVRKMSYFG